LLLLKVTEVERFLSSLYNYKLMSIEEFYKNEGKEIIEITNLSKSAYNYSRPDQRKLPSMLSNVCIRKKINTSKKKNCFVV
jgi:hypothetical protein